VTCGKRRWRTSISSFFGKVATVTDTTPPQPTVLVVDDEPDVADTYALYLQEGYETVTAYGGEEALDRVDESVDVVLLDRRMPDIPGDEVLDRIREAGYGCTVIMVTAVDADLNILEMDFDDYLSKPVRQGTVRETVEQHVDRSRRDNERLDEFFAIVSKLSVLEDEMTRVQLENSEEYQQLQRRAEELGDELSSSIEDFEEIVQTYREIERGT
jgi:DNA-binding response OmpR family regulator